MKVEIERAEGEDRKPLLLKHGDSFSGKKKERQSSTTKKKLLLTLLLKLPLLRDLWVKKKASTNKLL